jgi:quinol-cytochrome oxidoreductase complex cytochrome b subunit
VSKNKNGMFRRFWSSIFTGPVSTQPDRGRRWGVFSNLILHLHPRSLPEKTLKFTHTWGLGGMAATLVVLLTGTGVLLMSAYEPFPGTAYQSIKTIQNDVRFGQFIRNIHYWSGNVLVIMVLLHLLRVFFTGAIHGLRQFNWIIGLGLLSLVLLGDFTGYLLPWDQIAFWAITICTRMFGYIPGIGTWLQNVVRGGAEIGPSTLLIFNTFHSVVIPVSLIVLMAFHFWRTRKAGGVIIPRSGDQDPNERVKYVPTVPHLVVRELVVALVLIAGIFIISILWDAPLGAEANPGMSPNPAKAPWYFMGIQELLLHVHPFFAVLVIPTIVTCCLILLPYFKYEQEPTGNWFHSPKGRSMSVVSAIAAILVTPIGIIADEYLIDFTAWMPGLPAMVSNGVIPMAIVLFIIVLFTMRIKRRYSACNNETIQALFVFLLTSFIILTATGIWFRGPGMSLVWPWDVTVVPG